MEIANIVCKDVINIGPEFNVVDSVDDIIYTNLPTLVIGYEDAINLYGIDNINVLKRNIKRNLFWTFRRTVERKVYEPDVEAFIKYSYKKAIENINYVDVDVIQFSPNKLYKITKKILGLKQPLSYKSANNVIYIYSENLIFGVDINLLEYVGVDVEKVEKKIIDKSVVFLEGSEILIEYNNQLERLKYDYKFLPFLYSIKNPHD
jgi:hypothetical protein|tara:strand:+ start:8 stop:622 length:615 start_codon:yes stop_codon:yes gene_type:complete